jgi:hypothetical protein
MPSLETHLNSISFSDELNVVKNLINTTQSKITFWGGRVVEADGYTGSVYLDDLARKVYSAARQRSDADDLTPAERISGIEIVRKVQNFYLVTETGFQNSNFFTRLLNFLREFTFSPYPIRFQIDDGAEAYFRGYSVDKFLQQFGGALNETGDHPASDGGYAYNSFDGTQSRRITVRENIIRSLLIPASAIPCMLGYPRRCGTM